MVRSPGSLVKQLLAHSFGPFCPALTINGGTLNIVYNVDATGANVNVSLNAGSGNDVINIGKANVVNDIQWPLTCENPICD